MEKVTKEKTNKEKIADWFYSERDYNEGLSLLKTAAPQHKGLYKTLDRGDIYDNKQHLTYQLFKISGLTDNRLLKGVPDLKIVPDTNTDPGAEEKLPGEETKEKVPGDEDGAKEPEEETGEKLNNENSDLMYKFYLELSIEDKLLFDQLTARQKECYNDRAIAHSQMADLGDDNSEETIAHRIAYLGKIDELTQITEYIHNVKINWLKTGVKPTEEVLSWYPVAEKEEEADKKDVNDIPEIELQNELAKVRTRLSKATKKLKDLTGEKLKEAQKKFDADTELKSELIAKIDAIRNK